MINLAGNKDCDREIRRELTRCRIGIVEGNEPTGEVPATVTGQIGAIELRRAWYYWVAEGPVPLELAQGMYDDPIGRTDIRVSGHCGCPAPAGRHVARTDATGRRLVLDPEFTEESTFHSLTRKGFFPASWVDRYTFVRWESDLVRLTEIATVDLYHIDSEAGLRLFSDTVRRHLGCSQ
jgi:hypothetical protein